MPLVFDKKPRTESVLDGGLEPAKPFEVLVYERQDLVPE